MRGKMSSIQILLFLLKMTNLSIWFYRILRLFTPSLSGKVVPFLTINTMLHMTPNLIRIIIQRKFPTARMEIRLKLTHFRVPWSNRTTTWTWATWIPKTWSHSIVVMKFSTLLLIGDNNSNQDHSFKRPSDNFNSKSNFWNKSYRLSRMTLTRSNQSKLAPPSRILVRKIWQITPM